MDISINTNINIFKENLVNLIGNSQLPIGTTYYVLKDVFSSIESLYNQTLEKEKQELLKSLSKENEKDSKEEIEIEEN